MAGLILMPVSNLDAVRARLDTTQFAHDAELYRIAVALSEASETERQRYKKTETPFRRGLLSNETGYWSDGVPWFEWVSDVQTLDRCAKGLDITLADLADTIAYRFKPTNWLMFSWMAEAIRGRASSEAIVGLVERLSTKIVADRKHRQAGARAKLAKDPKQVEKELVRENWVLWQRDPHRYKGKAAFALDMLDKYGSLKSQAVIERWCREWNKGSGTQPAE